MNEAETGKYLTKYCVLSMLSIKLGCNSLKMKITKKITGNLCEKKLLGNLDAI